MSKQQCGLTPSGVGKFILGHSRWLPRPFELELRFYGVLVMIKKVNTLLELDYMKGEAAFVIGISSHEQKCSSYD